LLTEEAISSNGNGDWISLLLRGVGRWIGAQQVASDDDFGLDNCFASEDDVRCTDYLGTSRDFVARVLSCVSWHLKLQY
jgi:hypothetical protein